MCRCSYVHVSGTAVMVGYVVVQWAYRWACLFWCAAFLLLSISQGLRGTRGTYDWAMQSWASLSYRSATDTSLRRPSVSSLSSHSSARQQSQHQAGCSMLLSFHFRVGDCRAGAHITTRAKWTFLHAFLSKSLCWHAYLPPTRRYYVWITLTFTWPYSDLLMLW